MIAITRKPAARIDEDKIPQHLRNWKIECSKCGCKRQVVREYTPRAINPRAEVYTVYTLTCGHEVI